MKDFVKVYAEFANNIEMFFIAKDEETAIYKTKEYAVRHHTEIIFYTTVGD